MLVPTVSDQWFYGFDGFESFVHILSVLVPMVSDQWFYGFDGFESFVHVHLACHCLQSVTSGFRF